MELCTIAAYQLGWFSLINLVDMASYMLQASALPASTAPRVHGALAVYLLPRAAPPPRPPSLPPGSAGMLQETGRALAAPHRQPTARPDPSPPPPLSLPTQVAIFVLHIQREFVDEGWFSVLIATQNVLMWSKLHYFARVFNARSVAWDSIKRGGLEEARGAEGGEQARCGSGRGGGVPWGGE